MRRRNTSEPVDRPQGTRNVDSLHRGLEILRCFRSGESVLSLKEVSLRLGVPRPTTQRLVNTLVAHKFLRQIGDSDRYQPDVSCLVVGHAWIAGSSIVRAAHPIMQNLATRFDVNVVLSARERLSMLCLEQCTSPKATPSPVSVGMALPITATALGRAWLWAQPGSVQSELIQRTKSEGGEEGARSIPGLYRAFQEMEEHSYCQSSGEWMRDSNAIGTAVILHNGATYGLCCEVAGLGWKNELFREEIGEALLEAAMQIKNVAARIVA